MAAKEKDPELGGSLDRPAEMDNQQESYEKKFKEMQKYIPFLEMMIQKLERSSDKSREAQLLKMKSLYSILSNTKKKLKIETLKRCEDVLQKLYEKVEKGSASQQKTANSNTADVKKTNVTVKSTKSNNFIGNEPKDATNDQHVTSSTDDSPVANIMKSLKMTTVRSNSKNVSSTTLSPAHSSEDSRDEVPSTTCNISIESNNMKVRNKSLDNLEQSRERLKKLLGQNLFSSEGKAGSSFDTSADWKFQREAPWKKQSDIHSHPRDSSDKYHSDPHLREDTRKGDNLTLSFKDHRVQQYSDRWSNLNEERARTSSGKYDETYMCWTDYKPSTSRPSYHAEGDRYINIGPNFGLNTNMPMLSPTSVSTNFGPNGNKLMLSPTSVGPHANKPMHSPTSVGPAFGLNNNKSMLGPTSVSPIQHSPTNSSAPQSFGTNSSSPIKRQTSQNIPPLYNVLQHPPIAGSKPLSDADIEELMEDTSKSKPDKDTMKKEESALKSLRAKLEQEIQQVHKVGVSKGGALRNLVQKDEKLKSPTRGRLDLIKPNTEMRKDKSPTGTGICSDKQKTSPVDKNTENIESEGQKGELHNVDSRDKKPTDPRKLIPYSPRGEEECRSVNWDITKSPNLNSLDKRESNFKTLSDTKHNGSNSNTEASQDKSHEKANKDGSSILSSLSKEELQKIVEENLRNLPSLPPNTKEILETVSMNSPTVGMKPAWHSSPEMVSPLSPKEYNHGLPRNPTTFNSNFANARPALLPTPELPHDPRIHARNQTHDPRLGLNDSHVQGIVSHSVINDPRLNSSRHQSQENYRFSSHDQFTRRPYNLSSQTSFFSNHSSQPWIGTPCYGVLSHSSQRHLDEGFIHPNDSFSHRTTQGFQGHTSSQHEIAQFQGQIHPTHDSFSTGQQLSWQSQHSFRGGLPGSFHPSQPGQHHMERTLGLTKGPVDPRLCGSSSIGDPRLTNSSPMSSHVAGHRPTMPNTGSMQNTNSTSNNPQIRGSGTGSLARPSNTEGRLGSTFSERDRRRKSTEESEKLDTANRGSKDSRNVKISRDSKGSKEKRKNSSSPWVANSGRAADRRNSRDRRKDSDPRKYETNNDNKEAKKGKETELVSPLNSLYGVTIIPKTGKGYGFQKFRIPKIKRPSPPPSPPASSKASNLESSLESKLESQSDIVPEDQHTKEVSKTKSDDDLSDSKAAVYELDGDKNSEPRSKESVTQEWIEGLIRKSFESGEGKKFMEKAKLLEKLGESLKGKKLKKIKQILESDSESESDENVSESFKKKESKSGDKDTLNDDIGIPIEYNKKSKSRRIIESDDEHSTDSEPLAVKLQKRENAFESENTSDKVKKKFKIVSKSYEGQETKYRSDNENTVIEEQMEPVKKYSKRRSALELLQEDIREMFICEGVVTATGHRMCRLLKETRPGMTVDEITKSATKDIDDTSFAAEDSDGSSILVKKHDKNQSKDMDSGKKGKEGKQGKKQKAKVKLKDESVENGSEKIIESVFETEEQLSNVKIKKDDNALDETGDSSSSPVTKPRKKYEKSKWKGYVIEESEVSQDETEKEEFEFESSASFSNTNHSRKIKSGVSDSGDEYEGKEHGRRTRFPRIILEKADISKLNIVSSKSKAKYFEDSSSDESVERSSSSPMNSSKARQLQKSRRGRQSSVFRGRGRGSAAKKGQKKRSKSEKGEVSTDAENMISGQSSVANSMSQITDWASPYIVSGFTFRRKYTRKGSKLLGKKIDEIIKRLKKFSDDGGSSSTSTNNVDSEYKEDTNICKDDKSLKDEDAKVSTREIFSEFDSVEGESQLLTKKKDGHILLNLVKNSGSQKKPKKKKTRWQLGIINQSRKKSSSKPKPNIESNLQTVEHKLKEDLDNEKRVVRCESFAKSKDDNDEFQDSVVPEKREDYEDKLKHVNENLEIGEKESAVMCKSGDDDTLSYDDEKDKLSNTSSSGNLIDKGYILDGSAKYPCKLCPYQYKNIVIHYRNNHSKSEILISRLSEEEASQAIAEALQNDFEKEKDTTIKKGKRRKQAREFVCRICNHTASFPVNFYEHISSHTGEYRFQCHKCPTETVTRMSLKSHFNNYHSDLKGIEGFKPIILSQGPSKDAKIVPGYLCSSCNFVQLIKENTEKHISRRHSSEDGVKVICISMSKSAAYSKLSNESLVSERMEECKEDTEPSEAKISGIDSNKVKESLNIVNDELNSDEISVQPDSKDKNDPKNTSNEDGDKAAKVLEESADKEKDLLGSMPMEIDNEQNEKILVQQHETELKCKDKESKFENKDDDMDKENLEKVELESDTMNAASSNENSETVNVQDNENESCGNNVDVSEKETTVLPEPSTSATEEPPKEIDLKAFVCSDDFEEENSVIQKERLKKMEEIAKDLKDIHPKLLKPNRSSILDHLSDKLKTGFLNKSNSEKLDVAVSSNATDKGENEENKEKNINDSTTLIDEKRAIEAAQAVQNLLKSEKETCLDESGANSENKSVDSSMASKNEKFTKPDGVERRITRSFSKNEDEGDAESDDESSSDISFDFDADDNEDIPESESHSPDILMTETLSVLKDAGPGKSSSRMNNIIERLVSKVVTKSEPIDEAESINQTDAVNKAESLAQAKSINQPEIRDQAESVSLDQLESTVQPEQIEIARINESDKIHAREDSKSVETNEQVSEVETDAEAVKSSDTSSNVIGKPPPLMSLGELKDKNLLRNAVVSDITVTSAPIRVGPLEVKRFSDGLLYSCCVRGCIFASTNRMLFAMHLTNTHKLSRWDGSCKNCSIYTSEVHAQYKLSEALHHLITYHLVATPDDPMPSTEEAEKKSSLDENKSGIDERKSGIDENKSGISKNKSGINENKSGIDKNKSDIDENKSGIDKNKSGINENKSGIDENKSEPLLENSSSETGDIVTNKEEIVESPAPRKFIRLRRLSGDLLSVPKPPEPSAKEDLQNPPSDVDVPVNILSPMETTQEIEEQEGSTTNEDENGPFLRIESVVSLNPEAMATDDVHDILKAVEDPNTSKSSEKSDSMESSIDITLTTSSKSIFTMPSSSVCSTKSVVTQRPIMTSAPKSYLKASSSSDGQFTMLRGKLMRSHGSMQMIPVTPLSKSSSITLLPGQQMSPVKLGNVQLSPVKLHSLKNIDLTHKSNIPRSLVSLAKITGPTSSKGTIKLSKDRHGGLWQGQVLPAILPKTTTYVRVEIKDNKVTTKQVQLGTKTSSSLLLSSKPSMAPLLMATKALHTVPLTTTNVSFPIPSAQLETEMEAAATTGASPSSSCPIPPPTPTRRPKLNQNIVSPPPVPSTPATSTFLSTTVPKNKIPQKSAVAPSYAKASKLPAVYQEMIKPAKLRHLYKCMARHCSYSTDSEADYSLHYNEHERRFGLKGMTEKKKGRPAATLKFSEWQQCAYCCAMHTSLSKILEHIQTEHGYCLYQCAYCFYRAVSKAYVILHQNTGHINEHVAVLKCKESKVPQPPQEVAVPRHYAVVPYICGQGNCGAIFYISDNFTRHLEKEHSQLTMYSCHICGNKSFKPERLLAHYKLHSCCYYQCKYCLHGTDTKEDMHHHLCNFHSNQKAHVIIRSFDLQEHGKSEEILESLKILDLDEYMVDDNVLILPPPEDEPAPEDPTVCASQLVSTSNIEGITLLYPDQGQISGNSPSNEEILNAVSAISDSDEQNISGLLETETGNSENGKSDADQSSVKSNDAALQEGQIGSNKRNEDDVVVLDDVVSTPDISKAMQKNQFSTPLVNVKEGIVSQAQDSNVIDEINILSSDKDSDIECLGETNNLLRTESKSNDSQDSDVILLDNNTRGSDSNDVSKKTENADKHEVTSERNDSVLSEPMVTLKHRNPKTVAEIESAVDPLSSMNHTSENLNKSDINSDPRIIQPNELIFNEEPLVTLKHRDPKKFAEIEMAVDPLSLDDVGSSEIRPSNAETEGVSDSGDSKAGLKQGELSGSTLEEMEDTGLTGTSLYRCGYVTCTFSAEDSSLLKDHLLVCDLARDSSSLNCVHCKKQFKYVSSLLEHLRLHGTKRYGCGLCNFRAPVPQQVVKHLKQRHRVNSTKIVPLNPLKSDPETAMFVLFAKDKGKGGRGGKGYGKDGQDLHNKCVFLPEEIDILPRQAIYTKPVRCATCSYTTKVRSNMVRHLQLHISSNIPDVIPPNNAPVNPVPCLEKKEMMFDKMTNLAASSHIAAAAKSETPSGSLTLTQELEGKLPKYVPENQRYVCGAPECSYLTCDETMLRYHLRALHFDETAYRCPHCHESASTDTPGQVISIERMGAHLKMHDSRLYKCAHCIYHHFQRYVVERHLADKHPEKRPFVHVVREPEIEAGSSKAEAAVNELAEPGPSGTVVGTMKNPWQCGMCNFQCSTRSDVLDHTWSMHGLKSQYKCNLCSYRSSSKHGFDAHFASKHPTSTNVELVHVYRRVDVPQSPQSSAVKSGSAGHESVMFDTTPLWRRDMQRIRHIRGILLEEEGDVPKPDIVHRPSIEEFEEEEEEGVVEEQKGKEEQRQEEEKEKKDEPRGLFGPYGKPFGGIYYFCTICNKYRTKFKSDFRDHLFRELKYHKWVCTHCRLMSCSRNALQRHSAKVHEKDRKPEAIAPLTPNKDIEEWVEKVISTQLTLMKSEQQASQESTNKVNSASLAQPGPSGLVSRHCKSESSSGVSSVTKLLRFPCKHCKMKFSMARGLKCHIRHIHLKSKLWSCEHCQFVSSDEINVLKHSEVQHPDLPISYLQSSNAAVLKLDDEFWEREYGLGPNSDLNSLSSSSSPTSSPVKKRPRPGSPDLTDENSSASSVVDLPEESYNKCIHCNYFSRSASDLKYHVMRHWVQKPLKCAYCEFGGVREYEIKKHSLKAHPLMKVYIIEKPIPSQPEIRPLQRTKRSKPDLDASSPNVIQNKELRREEITSGVEVAETKKDVEEHFQEESSFTSEIPNIFRCFYCPQRGTSLVSIHQHWQEKHKNKSVGSNGVVRPGLPFKYKEVNMKQFLKGQDGSAGRKPALLCAYCKYRGTLTALEEHQRIDHPDKPFQANQACFTRYECAECHFTAFTVNTLKRHFDLEHQGKELQYLVKYTKEDVSGIKDKSKESLASVVCVPKPLPMPVVKTKYMCLWCEETCESEEKIQVHHALCHSHLQLKYSVERSNTPAPVPSVSTKRYGCPVCTFSSETRQIVFEHLYYHAKPYRCGYCIKTFEVPAKVRNHIFVNHPEHEFRMLHLEDVERELAKWRGEIIIRENSESSRDLTSSQKREYESIDLSPKRLCIARKSTTLSPRVRFHAVARKSTNPLPWQSIKHSVMDHMESGDTSPPSSRSESPASLQEYSFYGCRPSPVDKHSITASVKLRNNLGVLMNMSLSTMERFTNMYPVVRLKDLKHEKWMSL